MIDFVVVSFLIFFQVLRRFEQWHRRGIGTTDEDAAGRRRTKSWLTRRGRRKLPVQVAARIKGTSIIRDGHTDEE